MITKTMVTQGQSREDTRSGRVVDERSWSSENSGGSSKHCGLSLSLLLGGLGNSSQVSSSGLSDLRSVLNRFRSNTIIHWSNQRLGVEGGGDQRFRVEGGGNWETRVNSSESSSISNILNSLDSSISVNIAVSSTHSTIGVTNLVLD